MIIEILTGVTLFVGRVLLLVEERNGWVISIVGGILSLGYLIHSGLYIYMIAQSGFVLMSIYGLVNSNENVTNSIKRIIFISLSSVSLIVAILATIYSPNSIYLLQSLTSIVIMWSAYFIADKKPLYGWSLYVIGNGTFGYIAPHFLNQTFFGDIQIASALVALCGVYKNLPQRKNVVQ